MTTQPSFDDKSGLNLRGRQLDSAVWAAFFIWIGVAMLATIPWGWFLIGIGALIGVAQVARWQIGLAVDLFWSLCGALIFIAGLWEIFRMPWPLAPVALITLGIALFAKAFGAGKT